CLSSTRGSFCSESVERIRPTTVLVARNDGHANRVRFRGGRLRCSAPRNEPGRRREVGTCGFVFSSGTSFKLVAARRSAKWFSCSSLHQSPSRAGGFARYRDGTDVP